MDSKPNVKMKTFIYYIKQHKQQLILNWMTSISKNIYNCTLFVYKIYKIYQNDIYKELYDFIINNNLHIEFINNIKTKNNKHIKYDKNAKKEKKDNNTELIEKQFYVIYDKYYKLYVSYKKNIDSNNNIIYKYIINDITKNNIIVSNNNFNQLINKYLIEIPNIVNIEYNNNNKIITIDNIVNNIIKSLYVKNYFYIKNLLTNKKQIDNKYQEIVNVINNNKFIYSDENNNKSWRDTIIKILHIDKLSSVENFINRLAYKYLNNNKEKIPSDVIINIISKAYSNVKSYYALLKSGTQTKTNMSKFLSKDAQFNLFYYFRSFKILDDGIRLNVGNYIHNNYNDIVKNSYKTIEIKNIKYYYNENNLINLSKEKLKTNKEKGIKYTKINNKYIEDDKLLKFNYIYIPLPKKIEYNKINLIEIKPDNYGIKICITYDKEYNSELKDYDIKNYNSLSLDEKLKKTVSIDTGILNLLTIYDPIGEQRIIKGGSLLSINHFYNNLIDKLNSLNKKIYNKSKYKRLYSILKERENKINGMFNKIIDVLVTEYPNKEVFIVGYNPNWKHKVNMGKKNNRNFYQIAYKKFLDKLNEKLKCINKKLILVKESYTSKCDALCLENICRHDTYMGKRIKRGLYKSSTKQLINADLNGAINIMRKYIELKEITGKGILNPKIINIYEVMSNRPASKSTSQQVALKCN
jgi:IS605 OrfB family transposase